MYKKYKDTDYHSKIKFHLSRGFYITFILPPAYLLSQLVNKCLITGFFLEPISDICAERDDTEESFVNWNMLLTSNKFKNHFTAKRNNNNIFSGTIFL